MSVTLDVPLEGLPRLEFLGSPPMAASEAWWERPLTWIGTAVDEAAVFAMRTVVDRLLLPDPDQIVALRRSADPFLTGDLLRDPRRFLCYDDLPLRPAAVTTRPRRDVRGGTVLSRRLVTTVAPDDPIRVEHWVHPPGRSRGAMIAVHGFGMGNPRFDAFALLVPEWFRRGLDVALLTLPFHGARTPSEARFSGEHFARADVGQLNDAVRRALYEIVLTARWLRDESPGPVGILGLSLGGYLAASMAILDPELAFVIPMVPPVCFGDLAWRFAARTHAVTVSEHAPLTYDELRIAYRAHSPLTYELHLPRERVLIIAGRGDRIVPREHPTALWHHWGEPAIHWFSGSHLAPFGRGGIVSAVAAHLARLAILD